MENIFGIKSEETKMKASRKEKEVFVPVILELETQEEVDILYKIGYANMQRNEYEKICDRLRTSLAKYTK